MVVIASEVLAPPEAKAAVTTCSRCLVEFVGTFAAHTCADDDELTDDETEEDSPRCFSRSQAEYEPEDRDNE